SPRFLAGRLGEGGHYRLPSEEPVGRLRRLTFMMLDADIVAVSPTSVWRVLGQAGLLSKWNGKPSKKGTGFEQPLAAHQHWHIDVSYINISGTFYYLCSVLDGSSRYVVNWDLRESMTEADIEIILQRAQELHPDARHLVEGYVEHYNNVRLNSAVGYITPKDMLAGHQQEIHAERDQKLEAARKQRQNRRQSAP